MQKLNFSSSISSESGTFKVVGMIDNYFAPFSGRVYRVIRKTDDGKGYLVEETQQRKNWWIGVLKIVSYATIILPMMIGLAKVATRWYYPFYLIKNQDQTSKDTNRLSDLFTPETSERINHHNEGSTTTAHQEEESKEDYQLEEIVEESGQQSFHSLEKMKYAGLSSLPKTKIEICEKILKNAEILGYSLDPQKFNQMDNPSIYSENSILFENPNCIVQNKLSGENGLYSLGEDRVPPKNLFNYFNAKLNNFLSEEKSKKIVIRIFDNKKEITTFYLSKNATP